VRFADNRDGTATVSGPLQGSCRGVPTITVRVGTALHLTIGATGYPPPALAESAPLPSGLTFTDDGNGTAIIAQDRNFTAAITSALSALLDQSHATQAGQVPFLARP